MTKRKRPSGKPAARVSFTGRSVRSPLLNLKYIGNQLSHPLMTQDLDIQTRRGREPVPTTDVRRIICFNQIPACCLSAKGTAPTMNQADESAAHAMLDFFRLAISPEFVNDLNACADDNSIQLLLPQVVKVFEQFEKAINANFLSIDRCSQFEMTSAAVLRGKEVKKRVLMNLKDPIAGYAPAIGRHAGSTQNGAIRNGAVKSRNHDNSNNVLVLEDGDNEKNGPGSSQDQNDFSRSSSSSGDIVIVKEILVKRKSEPPSFITSQKASPQAESCRESDDAQRKFVEEQLVNNAAHNRSNVDSSYFAEANSSNTGPAQVFCISPNKNVTQFSEANYSDESEDERERDVPRKRLRIEEEEDVVLLNMTSSSQGPGKLRKESDEEIGDIVDEWNENDDNEEVEEAVVVKERREVEIDSATTTATTKNGNQVGNVYYNGHSSHKKFIEAQRLPANYQAKTIGVVYNHKLAVSVEAYVNSITEKSTDSVKNISKLAWDHYLNNSQPDATYRKKMRARAQLNQEIQKMFPDKIVNLQVTGSTINGCGSYNSDMDMCLCYPTNGYRGTTFDDFHCEKSYSTKVLRKIDRAVRRAQYTSPLKKLIKFCALVPAKVPIVKLDLGGDFHGIDIDINVNNIAGIYNSHLTHYYSLTDARFPALALLIKNWTLRMGICNAMDGYLNSYSIILLVVHYLQCGVTPAVLPNLQYLFPDKFDRRLPLEELRLYGDIGEKLPPGPPNLWSLGELLIGFFQYYAHFDFQNEAISVRSAQVVPRELLPREFAGCQMFIEEPFDAINTARSIRTTGHMNTIKAAFRDAAAVFSSKNGFTMFDLGVEVRARN